jgi:hypothetical protein
MRKTWTRNFLFLSITAFLLWMPFSQLVSASHDGLVISNLSAESGNTYEIADDGLVPGALMFVDRDYEFTGIPDDYSGLDYIRTADDDKDSTGNSFISFDVNQDVTVYVAYDIRGTSLPNWLADWDDTGVIIETDDTDLKLYASDFSAGQVVLGGNLAEGASGADSNYIVIVESNTSNPVQPSPTPDTAPTAPEVSAGSAQGDRGETILVPITINSVPDGLSGFTLQATVSNPSVARIDQVVLGDDFLNLNSNNDDISDDEALFTGIDTSRSVPPGASNVTLATLHLQALIEGSSQVQINIVALDDDQGFNIRADINDGSISVRNVAPSVSIRSDGPAISPGNAFTGSASIDDSGDQSWDATIDYGDSSAPVSVTVDNPSVTLEHVYSASGAFDVTVTVTDDDGASDSDVLTVTVSSVCPTLPGLTSPSQDIDGDGRCEDLNGNDRLDFDDIFEFFQHIDSAPIENNPDRFDFNDNQVKDMDDVATLFSMLVASIVQD